MPRVVGSTHTDEPMIGNGNHECLFLFFPLSTSLTSVGILPMDLVLAGPQSYKSSKDTNPINLAIFLWGGVELAAMTMISIPTDGRKTPTTASSPQPISAARPPPPPTPPPPPPPPPPPHRTEMRAQRFRARRGDCTRWSPGEVSARHGRRRMDSLAGAKRLQQRICRR